MTVILGESELGHSSKVFLSVLVLSLTRKPPSLYLFQQWEPEHDAIVQGSQAVNLNDELHFPQDTIPEAIPRSNGQPPQVRS